MLNHSDQVAVRGDVIAVTISARILNRWQKGSKPGQIEVRHLLVLLYVDDSMRSLHALARSGSGLEVCYAALLAASKIARSALDQGLVFFLVLFAIAFQDA